MIIPDLNLLLHAHNRDSPRHAAARDWWQGLMEGQEPVALAWVVILGFLRLATHPRLSARPLDVTGACRHVRAWLAQPPVRTLAPGPDHAAVLLRLLEEVGVAGNLTTDAHLAALAIEQQATLHSTDADFARFQGLRWRNPLL